MRCMRGFLKAASITLSISNCSSGCIDNCSKFTGSPISIKNLAILVRDNSKYKCKIRHIPFKETDRSKSREIYYREPDLKKIYKIVNYVPKIKLIDIIKEYTDRQLI